MLALFECVAVAIKDKGLRGLCEMVPAGPYVFDIANHAYKLYRDRKRDRLLREEIAKAAACGIEEAKRTAEEVARRVANEAPIEERISLELYLTQIPGAVRQSLKRADDPSGQTVPPDLVLDAPEDFAKLLPLRAPHFRPGADLPGRPGWHLAELLGAGGFGEVWLARHSFLPHPRAVKFCTDPKVRAKLTSHEGRVIARVMEQGGHPNVVPLLDAVLDGETPWLMYEYVGGGSLIDLILKWQSLPDADREALAVQSLSQLAGAVGAFHRLAPPIVHRDLKPANILLGGVRGEGSGVRKETASSFLTPDPSPLTPSLRITDFGIGGVAVDYLRTNPGGISLMTGWLETSMRGSYTPLYASPQQSRGAAPDPRDDVHALGVIGFQMLTGKLSEAPSPRFERELRRRGVSDPLIDLIGDCVESDATARPRDAAELAERLGRVKGAPASPRPTPPTPLPAGRGASEPPRAADVSGPSVSEAPLPAGRGVGGVGSSLPDKGPLDGRAAPPVIAAPPAPVGPTKWLVPLRGQWFARAAGASEWALSPVRLPGDVTATPGEAYRLALAPDAIGDDDLARLKSLAGLPGLEAVDLSGCGRVTDAGLMHLANLRGLKAVGLADTQVTDSGVALLLTRFPDLEAVGLSGCARVTQTAVPYLARMRKLKLLALPPRADTIDVRVEFARRRPACQLV